MAEVEIRVGGRSYRMACEDGQEAHLRAVASHLDAEATNLKNTLGDLSELRTLLMAGVMVADKLEARNADLRDAEGAVQHMMTKGKGARGAKAKPGDLFEGSADAAALESQVSELGERAETAEARATMAEAAAEEARARLSEAEERASAAEKRAAEAEDAAAAASAQPSQGLAKALNAKLADAEARANALSRDLKAVETQAAATIRDAAERVRAITGGLTA